MTMENYILISMFLVFGILFTIYSHHKKSYEKTAEIQGAETAKKKFKIIRFCGYFLILGAVMFGILVTVGLL
jgi:uncharacterized membrane protein